MPEGASDATLNTKRRRLLVYNGGFLTQKRVRRILQLAGWDVTLGKPGPTDFIGVWGKSPTSGRGENIAGRNDATVLRVEDSFLRSLHPGRSKEPPIGLVLDQRGVHFDSSAPTDLEILLASEPFDDTTLLDRARVAAKRMKDNHLSKFNDFHPGAACPPAPYVLVIDQTKGDASIEHGGSNAATFAEMLVFAQTEHPGSQIVIKAHPETVDGHRPGHFGPENENQRITYLCDPVSPWDLFEGAIAVYTVSSQLGFEAIYAGHHPRVFGQPFYAGWGLTDDEYPVARRERKLTRPQLFAGAMISYPSWYDPYRDQIGNLETAMDALQAEARNWRDDQGGYVAVGMRRWKHGFLENFFGSSDVLHHVSDVAAAKTKARDTGKKILLWGNRELGDSSLAGIPVTRVEDGFLRSRGLGAKLTPPLSLIADDIGIYYDPSRESRLEKLISTAPDLDDPARQRAQALLGRLQKSQLSKYNIGKQHLPDLPDGHRILVPGQVEDDASVRLGCQDIKTNTELLARARQENPDAILIYKPHPDVESGLRTGSMRAEEAMKYADVILQDVAPIRLIDAVDEVWTMTSTLGFEALLRGKPVTCLGMPFYAGWGLTRDMVPTPIRRNTRPNLVELVHACLIDYPRYIDPISGLPCPVEIVVERLETGDVAIKSGWRRQLWRVQAVWRSLRLRFTAR